MMETLYPIVRRVRRPLVVEDAPPVRVGNVEPVQPVAAKPDEGAALNEAAPPSDENSALTRNDG